MAYFTNPFRNFSGGGGKFTDTGTQDFHYENTPGFIKLLNPNNWKWYADLSSIVMPLLEATSKDDPRWQSWNNKSTELDHITDYSRNVMQTHDPVMRAGALTDIVSTAGGGSGGYTTMVPPGNSGGSVEDGTSDLEDTYGEWTKYLDAIREYSDAQSAREREAAEAQNAWQRETNQIAMDYNAAEAAKNRDWQEYMSNTAHQREVQDLMAAGLNPVLSASGGNGAAVTSGATASGVTSPGAKANVDNTFVLSLLSFLNNIMGYATNTAAAGISAGGVLGAARIAAESAEKNTSTLWGGARRLLDFLTQGLLR